MAKSSDLSVGRATLPATQSQLSPGQVNEQTHLIKAHPRVFGQHVHGPRRVGENRFAATQPISLHVFKPDCTAICQYIGSGIGTIECEASFKMTTKRGSHMIPYDPTGPHLKFVYPFRQCSQGLCGPCDGQAPCQGGDAATWCVLKWIKALACLLAMF